MFEVDCKPSRSDPKNNNDHADLTDILLNVFNNSCSVFSAQFSQWKLMAGLKKR